MSVELIRLNDKQIPFKRLGHATSASLSRRLFEHAGIAALQVSRVPLDCAPQSKDKIERQPLAALDRKYQPALVKYLHIALIIKDLYGRL